MKKKARHFKPQLFGLKLDTALTSSAHLLAYAVIAAENAKRIRAARLESFRRRYGA